MKKIWVLILIFSLASHGLAEDIIITKKNKKYHGTVVKITENGGFVVKIVDGTMIMLSRDSISQIIRGKSVLDFEDGIRYYMETRRPFLPFAVLGIGAGVFAVSKFQDYSKNKKKADELEEEANGKDWVKKSQQDMAWGIVGTMFSIGSFYIALKPMEVKVPVGRLKLTAAPQRIQLSLNF